MSENDPRPEDVSSPEAIVKAMYETISGLAGQRNWQRERSLFLPGARLIPIGKRIHGKDGLQVLTVDEWIDDVSEFFAENDFWESEITSHVDRFGNMAQVFSTYEARDREDGAPIGRGINSIQLLFDEGRWWIVSVMWDNETRENPIPGEFTPYLW
jgi:hypothetical protein